MTSPTDLGQQSNPWPPWSEGTLLLGLLHQGLVREYRLELVAGDGDDKHPEEDGLHDEEDAVQDAGLLHADVLT